MVNKFDLRDFERGLTVVLATRSGNKLGRIPIYGTKCNGNMSFPNFEISFSVNKNKDNVPILLWNQIVDFKLIWIKEWDVWCEIYVDIEESNSTIKNIIAKSLGEAELSQINLYGFEANTENDILREDYSPTVFYDDSNPNVSLLNRLLYKAPHYKIGHVDASLRSIQRSFSFDGDTILDALQSISEEIHCLFLIDSGSTSDGKISRTINVYDLESYCLDCQERDEFLDVCPSCGSTNVLTGYGEDTNIFVSSQNLATNITYSTDVGSVKNCFKLEAGDDLMTATVISCNPNGSDYLWYISDEEKSDMSDELVSKLEEYDKEYAYYQNEHITQLPVDIVGDYNELVANYLSYSSEIQQMSEDIIGYSALMTAYYNTIDFSLFLNHQLMPDASPVIPTAADKIALLNQETLSPIAFASLSSLSETTATNAVLSFANAIVGSKYRVKVTNASLSGNIWTGTFTVTNQSNEEDTATGSVVQVEVNDSFQVYTQQKLDKVLGQDFDDSIGIVNLFKMPSSQFSYELKRYCLSHLKLFKDSCQGGLNVLIEQGVSTKDSDLYEVLYADYRLKLQLIEEEIRLREEEISVVSGKYDSYGGLIEKGIQNFIEDEVEKIKTALNLEKYFGEDLWLELCSYRREDTYHNDNYISDGLDNAQLFSNAFEFILSANKEIFKSSNLQHSISASLRNLLAMPEFKPIVDNFAIGNWIRIRVDEKIYRLRLINIEIDFDNLDDIGITFSDIVKTTNGINDAESILNQAASMSTSYGSVSRQASKGDKGRKQLDDWVERGLALTQMKIVDTADNQNITFDHLGLSCKEYLPITDDYDDKQLKLINRGIYLTDDGWLTSRVGIGNFQYYDPETNEEKESYGVIADTIVGKIILSEKVGIYNKSRSINMDENGFVITSDDTNSDQTKKTFTIQKKTLDDNGNEVISPLLYVDNNGELVMNGSVKVSATNSSYSSVEDICNSISETIVGVDVLYSSSPSMDAPPDDGWSTVAPAWQEGYYIWQKTVTRYNNGQIDESAATCISGANGLPGEPAKLLSLYSSSYVIAFDKDGKLKDTSNISLLAIRQNDSTAISWSALGNGKTSITLTGEGLSRELSADSIKPFKFITVTVRAGDLNDTVTITKVEDGTNGAKGKDATVVLLTNEAHTFEGGISSAVVGSVDTQVIGFTGTVQKPVVINSVEGLPNGMTYKISNNGTENAQITFSVTSAMATANGTVSINCTCDGTTFDKIFSYSLSLVGEGIEAIAEQYYLSSSKTVLSDGEWSNESPNWKSGWFIWTRSQITWESGKITHTDPVLANAINDANGSAEDASKVATNYLSYGTDGLIVGYKDGSGIFLPNRVKITGSDITVGDAAKGNTYVSNNGVYLRNSTDIMAAFESDKITLGKTDGVHTCISPSGMTINYGDTGITAVYSGNSAIIGRTSDGHFNTLVGKIDEDNSGLFIRQGSNILSSFTADSATIGQETGYHTVVCSEGLQLYSGENLSGTLSYKLFALSEKFAPVYGLAVEGELGVGIGTRNSDYKLWVDNEAVMYRGGYSTAPWVKMTFNSGSVTEESATGNGDRFYNFNNCIGRLNGNWGDGFYLSDEFDGVYGVVVPYSGHIKVWASAYMYGMQNDPVQCGVYIYRTSSSSGTSVTEEVQSTYISSSINGAISCAPAIISVQDGDCISFKARCRGTASVGVTNKTTFLAIQYL